MNTLTASGTTVIADAGTCSKPWQGLECYAEASWCKALADVRLTHPEVFHQILLTLFGAENSLRLGSIRVDLGRLCDLEEPFRAAGLRLAADARRTAPELEVAIVLAADAASAEETPAESDRILRLLQSAFTVYGLTIDRIICTAEEPETLEPLAARIAKRLNSEAHAPYAYSAIEVCAQTAEQAALPDVLAGSTLITGISPWSGHYSTGPAMQFSRQSGWLEVESSCNDSELPAPMTYLSPDRRYLTMHLANPTEKPKLCRIILRGMQEQPRELHCAEVSGDPLAKHPVRSKPMIRAEEAGEPYFTVTLDPYAMLTLTTDRTDRLTLPVPPEDLRLLLPWSLPLHALDEEDAAERSGAPLYTCDQSGRFVLAQDGETLWLEQHGTAEAVTTLGDTHWANYQGSAEAVFGSAEPENFIGIGIRCQGSEPGLSLRLYADGRWELRYRSNVLADGAVPEFDYAATHKIGIAAVGTLVLCFADGHSLREEKLDRPLLRSGCMALLSGGHPNRFREVQAEALPLFAGSIPAACRIELTAAPVKIGALEHWKRSMFGRPSAQTGAELEVRFYGSSISVIGEAESGAVAAWMDGRLYTERREIRDCFPGEALLTIEPIRNAWHTLRLQVLDGEIGFAGFEIPNELEWGSYRPELLPPDPLCRKPVPKKQSAPGARKAALAGAAAAGLAVVGVLAAKRRGRK